MEKQTFRTTIDAPIETVWAWHARPASVTRALPPWERSVVIEAPASLEKGTRVVTAMADAPDRQRVLERTEVAPLVRYVEEQRAGIFQSWRETRSFTSAGPGKTLLEDVIELETSGGASKAGIARRLKANVGWRHEVLKADCELAHALPSKPLTVAITGASGLVATALTPFLSALGHTVRPVRQRDGKPDAAALESADAVVHLAGAAIAEGRWTEERKLVLTASRVDYTRELVEALKRAPKPPQVLVSGSAIGVYGHRGDEVLSEASTTGVRGPTGAGFLAGVCLDWEAEAKAAEALGSRVVALRTGLVLSPKGGFLGRLLPMYRLGAGGPIGSGGAYLSWVSIEDLIRAIYRLLVREQLTGPVNAVAPKPVTGLDFALALGRVLARPAVLPLPAFALRVAFGEMAEGAMLASQRVEPKRLLEDGAAFVHPVVDQALAALLGKREE